MPLRFLPAAERDPAALIDAFNRAFAGYVGGDIELDRCSFAHFLMRQGVDLAWSIAAVRDDRVVGLALVARRGHSSRLAAMAVVPEAQGQGVGGALVDRMIADAVDRGDRRLELEVIGGNAAAERLYRGRGFAPLQRLVALEAPPLARGRTAEPESVDPYRAACAVARHGVDDLPWQLDAPSLATLGHPVRGARLGPAWALVGPPTGGPVQLLALVVAADARGLGHGTRLLEALRARDHGRPLHVPALVPERLAGFFERRGFRRGSLWQWHMARPLDATGPDEAADEAPARGPVAP